MYLETQISLININKLKISKYTHYVYSNNTCVSYRREKNMKLFILLAIYMQTLGCDGVTFRPYTEHRDQNVTTVTRCKKMAV